MVAGYVGGSSLLQIGGGSNYLCMRRDPITGPSSDENLVRIFGAQYSSSPVKAANSIDVPCAVCVTPRKLVLMIPGRNQCDDGWHTEYVGYLAAETRLAMRTEYVCVDNEAEANPDGKSTTDRRYESVLLVPATTSCSGSLPCPPYENQKNVLCAVCSR